MRQLFFGSAVGGDNLAAAQPPTAHSVAPNADGGKQLRPALLQEGGMVGMSLVLRKLTLEQLRNVGGPAVLLTRDAGRYVVLSSVGKTHSTVYLQGRVLIVLNSEISAVYSGDAILGLQNGRSQTMIAIDNPVRVVPISASDSDVRQTIAIRNRGERKLNISVDHLSCGCTSASFRGQRSLDPGESTFLDVTMKTTSWGDKSETVSLKTDDPNWQKVIIGIQASAPKTVVPSPGRLDVELPFGQGGTYYVGLLTSEHVTLDKIKSSKASVHASIVNTEYTSGGIYRRIKVDIAPGYPSGVTAESLEFNLNHSDAARVSIPLTISVKPNITSEPSSLFLGEVSPGHEEVEHVVLHSGNRKAFRIVSASSDLKFIKIKSSPEILAEAHAVECLVSPPLGAKGLLQGKILFQLSDGTSLEVPVIGMISTSLEQRTPNAVPVIGKQAPNFDVVDMNGNHVRLSDMLGKHNVLLTFFPRCFTGGCAGHLASVERAYPELLRRNVQVFAVSVDSATDQVQFAATLGAKFQMIPDQDRSLSLKYGAVENDKQLDRRMSVVIDTQGLVRIVDTDVSVTRHGEDLLNKLEELDIH